MANSDDGGLAYWLRWQVPVCALTFIVAAAVSVFFLRRARTEPLRSGDLWLSCWRNLHPIWLLLFRAFAFLIMVFLLCQMFEQAGVFIFFFYTQWTFVLVMIYFALGTIISAYGCLMCSKKRAPKNRETDELLRTEVEESRINHVAKFEDKHECGTIKMQSCYNQVDIQQKAGFWGYLMLIIYQTSAGAAILTDIVFWGVLVPLQANGTTVTLLIGCMHSLNALLLLLDTSMNNLPFHWSGIAYFVFWTCLYGVFQWVVHACGVTWWPYPFLDLSSPWAPLWYFAIAVVQIPCYGIYALLINAKFSICSRFFPDALVRH